MSEIAALNETVTLTIDGQSFTFPVTEGTENEKGIDISKLRGQTGYVTLDPGFKNTGSCSSAITFLDGEEGILRYRGYSIEDLADKASFLEVAYLCMFGELPNASQLEEFTTNVMKHSHVPENVATIIRSFPADGHPMGILSSAVCALHANFPESLDPYRSDEDKLKDIYRLIGMMPALAAMIYRRSKGGEFVASDESMEYSENFLNMMYNDGPGYEVPKAVAVAINKLLILHADHEQNCSASTARLVGSSHANLYATISAANNALWGPLHGGANQKVIEMLEGIKEDGGDHDKWLAKAKDKDDPFRLMGFGHRVYKNFDPRARIIKKSADEVLGDLGIKDPVLGIAKKLEEAALSDDYFVARKLYPNVDFYSGIIYRALGIPVNMFTVMFTLGRLPGWIAQWKEMRDNGEPIGRPRQIYVGENLRPFVAIENR